VITLFGHVLGKKNRLRLEYELEWCNWAPTAGYGSTFPSFEAWQATLTEFQHVTKSLEKETVHVA
jgi:hypothetical protein